MYKLVLDINWEENLIAKLGKRPVKTIKEIYKLIFAGKAIIKE